MVNCEHAPLFYQILRFRQFPVVQVHVPLGSRDVRVAQQPPGEAYRPAERAEVQASASMWRGASAAERSPIKLRGAASYNGRLGSGDRTVQPSNFYAQVAWLAERQA